MNFLKFIELCFQTVVPGCEYNDYQYIKVIADRLEAANVGKMRRIIFNMPPRSIDLLQNVIKKINLMKKRGNGYKIGGIAKE